MNAIEDNSWSRGFRSLGEALPMPRAILCISAHWYGRGLYLTADAQPKTIHDFGGFPQALYEMQYPASGSPDLARRVLTLLEKHEAGLRDDWGLDHGTWSVLYHLRPAADVPVVQLSLDVELTPHQHLTLGQALAPLRDEGVLVMGSGNITHNLGEAFRAMRTGVYQTPDWATQFDADIAKAVIQHDQAYLTQALSTELAERAHPTPDHYWPLLYAAGAGAPEDVITFPITGFDLGSLSMRAIRWG